MTNSRFIDSGEPNTILEAYSETLSRVLPDTFYDVSVLLHEKLAIKNAVMEVLSKSKGVRQRGLLKTNLLLLAYFQSGVGDNPVRNPMAANNGEDLLAVVERLKANPGQLSSGRYHGFKEKADFEQQSYMNELDGLGPDYPPHHEFKESHQGGKLRINVQQVQASKLVRDGLVGNNYRLAQLLYEWLWFGGLIGGVILLFYKWWLALIVLFIAFKLPAAIRSTAAQGIRDKMLADEAFYNMALESGLADVEPTA